jgi:hypothetical protein
LSLALGLGATLPVYILAHGKMGMEEKHSRDLKRDLWIIFATLIIVGIVSGVVEMVWKPTVITEWVDLKEGGPPHWLPSLTWILNAIGGLGMIAIGLIEKLRRK